MRTPVQLLEALDLTSTVAVEELASRRRAFEGVHMGMADLPIGTLLDLLRDESWLKPPRTGHLGNWQEIAAGRAGPMDFNHAICTQGYGYPLIYSFTQTEAEGSAEGDWVYLPGSRVERGVREVLPLFTWDGTAYVRRSRHRPLFCPFVQTGVDGALVPLTELHWRRMQEIPRLRFVLEAAVVVERAAEVRPMLALLLEEAARSANPRRAFQELIGYAVAPDGTVVRCELRREGRGYRLGDCDYPTTDALVEAALVPFRAVTTPRELFAEMGGLPPLLPVLSNLLVGIFSAIFGTHYPDPGEARDRGTRPFNPHLHWGARDMAGYPPRRRGYFATRASARSHRGICTSLVAAFPDVAPLCIVLLPAAVFMLCPTSAHPRDAELLADLFGRVAGGGGPAPRGSHEMQARVEDATRAWLARYADELSPYFLNRFRGRGGVLHPGHLPSATEPEEPEGFRALTLRQACMTVGALVEIVSSGAQTWSSLTSS